MKEVDVHSQLLQLRECETASLEQADREACANLREKLEGNVFHMVVAGQFKRGKSSIINALLGAPLLPVGVVPLTSVITVLQHGDAPCATVMFFSGDTREVDPARLGDYVTERGNPRNVKGVREVSVSYPSDWLVGGIRLVDTPGIGSVYEHNTDVAFRYLPQADAVLFVGSVDQPVGRAELDFLASVRQYADRVFCLLNKADYLSPEELRESVAFSTHAVQEALGTPVPVFAVSARMALDGKAQGSQHLVERSLLPEFDAALRRFLVEEKQVVWLRSMRNNLLRILAQAHLVVELELESLRAPLERLDDNLRRFAAKKQESLQAKSDFQILLEGEASKLVKEQVEPRLAQFKAGLESEVVQLVEQWFGELRELPSKRLQAAVEQRTIAEVRARYDRWRAVEDAEIACTFDALCARFSSSLQATADDLLRYSAELFSIPFEAVRAESLWQTESRFYYKFWDEPTSLRILSSSIVLALPKFLGERLILERMKQTAVELIETQAGRVRYDFEERLKKSVMRFRREMLARMDATSAGIEHAIERGVTKRRGGEAEVQHRRAALERGRADWRTPEPRAGNRVMDRGKHICPGCFSLIAPEAQVCPTCGQRIADFTARDYGEKLLHALHHPLSEVRMRAIIALGWRGQAEAAQALVDCALRHPVDVIEGLEIVGSLHRIEARHPGLGALEQLAERHPGHAVSAAARKALSEVADAGRRFQTSVRVIESGGAQ